MIGAALVMVAGAPAADAQTRQSLFPAEGCSPASRINPCARRALPAPAGDPTDGPLTDALNSGPLDPPKDPLGFDAPAPAPRAPLLAPAKDRLGPGGKG
jgi:hypothetical protein